LPQRQLHISGISPKEMCPCQPAHLKLPLNSAAYLSSDANLCKAA